MLGSVSMATTLLCLLFGFFLLQNEATSAKIQQTDPHFLSDVTVVRPIRTDSEGRVLPGPAPWSRPQEAFYKLSLQGAELQLRLRISSRLTAPGAALLWEESGESEPITEQHCLYSGHASNDQRITAALNICDGLEGVILTPAGDFYISPLMKNSMDHVIYRPTNHSRAQQKPANQSSEQLALPTDFLRGPGFGSEVLKVKDSSSPPGPGSGPAPGLGLDLSPGLSPGLGLDLGSLLDSVQSLRKRRSTEAELFHIEVLLAVDYSVLLFHGRENIQRYLLTFMHIVNEIYQEPSLGANINIVLVQIVLLSATKSQSLVAVGDAQKSLENVCTWSFLHQREQRAELQHDITIYLSRQEFGPSGMQGYAPVTGMCQLIRSCVLVIDDGFSSAFVAAHEMGHVLGMEHDGEVNDCEDDVLLGSIMSPQVQASFYRYHWSRCSWRELHQYLHTYECLRDDPFLQSWPLQPLLPGFSYSMDQQCQFDWGHGFTICTTYTILDPCKQLWCSHYNNPFYCKTKKGPPLDGTRCGPGQHCFRGNCVRITPDLLRTHGAWGKWSPFGSCSRSCRSGVQFRTRKCDSPSPANGGRTCFGNSYEFRICNRDTPCPELTDYRAEQCKVWNPFFEHNGTKHHWLPLEHSDPDERCRLFCISAETGAVVTMGRMMHDGTLCSYDDQHSVCVRGECEHVGCDGQIASDKTEDRCGVCGGDNSSCRVVKGNFTRSAKKNGFLKILEIPKGARHLMIQEFKNTPHVIALKNIDTDLTFLNDEHHFPESRAVVEGGVLWKYVNEAEAESVQTDGPLKYTVLLMVRSHGEGKVTISYKYVLQEALRSSLDSNLVLEDTLFYEWALKRWSSCSRPCGGGKQYTRFGCRRKADGKMVHRMFCSNINKPRAIHRDCNRDECSTVTKWTTGHWEPCSASCGQSGWQRRLVQCQQVSTGGHRRSVPSKLCSGEKPASKSSCNRVSCPATWRSAPWSPCSVSCGPGTQERQVKCLTPEGSPGNCSAPQPVTTQKCLALPCSGPYQKNSIVRWLSRSNPDSTLSRRYGQRCRGDRSVFCQMEVLSRYCSLPGYRVMCCSSCAKLNNSTLNQNHTTFNQKQTTLNQTILNQATLNSSSDISPPQISNHNVSETANFHKNPKLADSRKNFLPMTHRTWTTAQTEVPLPDDKFTTKAPPPEDLITETLLLDDITITKTAPHDDITTTLAPPLEDIATTEAPLPDYVMTEAPHPDDITTTEATPPDYFITEALHPDDITTTEAPPPDYFITEALPPDDITTTEAPSFDDVTTMEASPPDDVTDYVYVDYSEDYNAFDWTTVSTETEQQTTMISQTVTMKTTKTRPPKRTNSKGPPPVAPPAPPPPTAPPDPPSAPPAPPDPPEVQYSVVGVAYSQSEFVPRKMPRFRERTQNKRIEELLREKRQRLTGL